MDWFFLYFTLLCAAIDFDFILTLINFDCMSCNANFDLILYYNLFNVQLNSTYLLTSSRRQHTGWAKKTGVTESRLQFCQI